MIDNLASLQLSFRYAASRLGAQETLGQVGRFFRFFLFRQSWAQVGSWLDEEKREDPRWDLAAVRRQGDRFLVESVPAESPFRAVAERALEAGTLEPLLCYTDEELTELCDERAIESALAAEIGRPSGIPLCQTQQESLAAIRKLILDPRGIKSLRKLIEARGRQLRETRPESWRFDLFVYGHTHEARSAFSPRRGGWTPAAVNTGAWQRVADREQIAAIRKRLGNDGKPADLTSVRLEHLPACYSLVLVEPYTDSPSGLLHYWRQVDGTWQLEPDCGAAATLTTEVPACGNRRAVAAGGP